MKLKIISLFIAAFFLVSCGEIPEYPAPEKTEYGYVKFIVSFPDSILDLKADQYIEPRQIELLDMNMHASYRWNYADVEMVVADEYYASMNLEVYSTYLMVNRSLVQNKQAITKIRVTPDDTVTVVLNDFKPYNTIYHWPDWYEM